MKFHYFLNSFTIEQYSNNMIIEIHSIRHYFTLSQFVLLMIKRKNLPSCQIELIHVNVQLLENSYTFPNSIVFLLTVT